MTISILTGNTVALPDLYHTPWSEIDSTANDTNLATMPYWTTAVSPVLKPWHLLRTSPQPKQPEEPPVRYLYRVYIVDPATDQVTEIPPFVAKDEATARLKALQKAGDKIEKDVDQLDFVVVALGQVRAKKEIQEVKIAK